MHRPTDHRNVDLLQLNLDIACKRAGRKVIWQPRILCYFADRSFRGEPLPEPYEGMTTPEIYRSLGCSNRIYDFNACFRSTEANVTFKSEPLGSNKEVYLIETPVGTMSSISRSTPNSFARIQEKRLIERPEDMKVATWLADHTEWEWKQYKYEEICNEWGRLGAPNIYMPRVNVQDLYINTMGVERGVYALMEWGTTVDDYFRALHESHMRLIEVINKSPIELINFGDNIHCATLSPTLYEKYVLPAYIERCEKLHLGGKFVNSHWDGDTKAILKYAKISGLDGIEAITPLPQGDVTLEEIKDALGDEIIYLDGIPAVLFDTTYSEEELAEFTEKLIRLFAGQLILGISDEMSSQGDLERIRLVGKIVDDHNAGVAAN